MKTHWPIVQKESAQMLCSQRGLLWLLAYSGLFSGFSLLLVSNTELSLLDNAQVVYMMAGTILVAGAAGRRRSSFADCRFNDLQQSQKASHKRAGVKPCQKKILKLSGEEAGETWYKERTR
jgi:hypothetical protein